MALVGRVAVTSLESESNKVTSLEAVLKTIPRVPSAPGPAVVPDARPAELTVVSPPPEPPEPQPGSKIPTADVLAKRLSTFRPGASGEGYGAYVQRWT